VKFQLNVIRSFRFFFVLLSILLIAQRSPAPIIEEEEPTPAPAAEEQPTKSKRKSGENSEASKPAQPKKPKERFAGTWTGIMKTFPAGNQTTQIVIDSTETTMTVSWFGKTASSKAQLNGDTLQATFPPPAFQPEPHHWAITPQPDGVSARVHFQCFLNDFTAVFHRVARAGANKTAR